MYALARAQVHTFTEVGLGGRRCCQLAAGDHNCAILTSSGRVMVCGSNQSAQCGMPSTIPCSHAFLDLGPNAGWHGAVWTPNNTPEVRGCQAAHTSRPQCNAPAPQLSTRRC